MYTRGEGVRRDHDEAYHYYYKAAVKGYNKAMLNLGDAHFNGRGVKRSRAKAIYWYRRAHEHGNKDAAKRLRVLGLRP